MEIIAVDVGNSATKFGFCAGGTQTLMTLSVGHRSTDQSHDSTPAFDGLLERLSAKKTLWVVSSVNPQNGQQLQHWVQRFRPDDVFRFIEATDIPLTASVANRQTVGRDRLLSAWAALELAGAGPVLIVDAGTAVTIDVVGPDRAFRGGLIFPGGAACLKALAQSTAALPDLSQAANLKLTDEVSIGDSTSTAILCGVWQQQFYAIHGIVERLVKQFEKDSAGDCSVFVTGGGIKPALDVIPADWNYQPDLVLQGAVLIGKSIIGRETVA